MARERILLTLRPGLLARVDAARGSEPRVRWIERAIERALGGEVEYEAAPTPTVPSAPTEPLSALDLERQRREAFARAASRSPKRS